MLDRIVTDTKLFIAFCTNHELAWPIYFDKIKTFTDIKSLIEPIVLNNYFNLIVNTSLKIYESQPIVDKEETFHQVVSEMYSDQFALSYCQILLNCYRQNKNLGLVNSFEYTALEPITEYFKNRPIAYNFYLHETFNDDEKSKLAVLFIRISSSAKLTAHTIYNNSFRENSNDFTFPLDSLENRMILKNSLLRLFT